MNREKLNNVLKELESDHASELNRRTKKHRFPLTFEKKALAVCNGSVTDYISPHRTRRLPFWAAAVIILLLCALVTGCAVAVYKYFTRYIPNYGIVGMYSDVKMYTTERPLTVGDMEIETVLYIRDGDTGTVRLWASGPALSDGFDGGEWMKTPVFTVKTNNGEYPVFCTSSSVGKSGGFYECEAEVIPEFDSISLIRKDSQAAIQLYDISEKGYTVSGWVEYDGITIKALPLYANNRIFIISTEGIENAEYVSATLTVYDSLGNSTKAGSGSNENGWYVLTADEKLPGDIVKIEIDSLRIRCTPPQNSVYEIAVPAADGEYNMDKKLLENPVFTETAVTLKRDGEYLYLTTKIDAHKYQPLPDFYVEYDSSDVRFEEWNTVGINTVIYTLKLNSDTDKITLSATRYMYMIWGTQDEPIGVIEVKKSK